MHMVFHRNVYVNDVLAHPLMQREIIIEIDSLIAKYELNLLIDKMPIYSLAIYIDMVFHLYVFLNELLNVNFLCKISCSLINNNQFKVKGVRHYLNNDTYHDIDKQILDAFLIQLNFYVYIALFHPYQLELN
jgi:hypothetical protein